MRMDVLPSKVLERCAVRLNRSTKFCSATHGSTHMGQLMCVCDFDYNAASNPHYLYVPLCRVFYFFSAAQKRHDSTITSWYTLAVLGGDAYELYRLWTAQPRSLSSGSYLFDASADAPVAVALYTGVLLCLMLPRFFVLAEPLSRWVLMLETIHDALRVLLYSGLFMVNQAASQVNTMLITFALWNTFFYGRTYHSTMSMLREHSK